MIGVRLSSVDSVAVCVRAVPKGSTVHPLDVVALDDIPAGHKIALADVDTGAVVLKYGQPIGVATRAIRRGEHVHTHNLASARAGGPR